MGRHADLPWAAKASTKTLLPCPFCGGEHVESKHTCGASYVICQDCNACGPVHWTNSETRKKIKKARRSWNRRAY